MFSCILTKDFNIHHVSFYNQERFQKKLKDRSPVEYRKTVVA
ncbi:MULTISPECIES: IS3 family transposase [Paenibacillus]